MKKFFQQLTVKRIVLTVIGLVSFLLYLTLAMIAGMKKSSLQDQRAAVRWAPEGGAAQISCFFAGGSGVDPDRIIALERDIDAALLESSIVASNENARLWMDAYSASGKLTLKSGKTSLETEAIGVGGDFFQFHPLQLLNGGYFSGSDLMHDSVVLDENAAWQLFGSFDVAGMSLTIDGIPHYVAGVVKRPMGRINEASGLAGSLVFVSYESLTRDSEEAEINTYEIVMPEPVRGYAFSTVQTKLAMEERDLRMVDNGKRFTLRSLLTVIAEFGTRSMNHSAVGYPYWENAARGFEDILALLLVFEIIFLSVPIVMIVTAVVLWWRHKNWTFRDAAHAMKDGKDRIVEKFRREENKWKHF